MYHRIFFRYLIISVFLAFIILAFFYFSPFSSESLFVGLISSVYVVVLSLIMNERKIFELPHSSLFSALRISYSLTFFSIVFAVGALLIDRIIFLFSFIGFPYSSEVSFKVNLTLCIGGYTLLSYFIWWFLNKNPTGVAYRLLLSKDIFRLLAVFFFILAVTYFIFDFLSPFILTVRPPPFLSLSIVAVLIFVLIINTDYSRISPSRSQNSQTQPKRKRLFLIGLDAADWKILTPLIKKNRMPHLHKILKNGSYGYLDCYGKRLSPTVWTSVVTGATAEKHGIKGFIFHQKGKGEPVLYKSYHRKVPAIWNILSSSGKKVGVLNWMVSYPAEKVKGYIISSIRSMRSKYNTFPDDLGRKVSSLIMDSHPSNADNIQDEWLKEINDELESLKQASTFLLDSYHHDAFIVYSQTTDNIMHKFWHYREPRKFKKKEWILDDALCKKYTNTIDEHWTKIDEWIGNVLSKADENTNLVILSDHGSRARVKPLYYIDGNIILEKLRLLKFQKDQKTIDDSRTKIYSADSTIWNNYYAFSLNVKGREPHGIIPSDHFEEERERIVYVLRNLRTSSGKKFFGRIQKVNSEGVDITAEHTHLMRELNNEKLIVNKNEIRIKDLLKFIEGNSGNHDPRGIIILSGPSFKKKIVSGLVIDQPIAVALSYIQGLSERKFLRFVFEILKRIRLIHPYTTMDVMPTLLHSLGYPITDYMNGKIMMHVIERNSKDSTKFQKIKEYNIPDHSRQSYKLEKSEEDEMKDHLKGLGYLD